MSAHLVTKRTFGMLLFRAFILAVILGVAWSPTKAIAFARPVSEKITPLAEISQLKENLALGAKVASCDLSPFGQLIRSTGVMAKNTPFRFSTKYWDDETNLVYYGYRHYRPTLGRRLGSDSNEEDGVFNLYVFTEISGPNNVDLNGLSKGQKKNIRKTGLYGNVELEAALRNAETQSKRLPSGRERSKLGDLDAATHVSQHAPHRCGGYVVTIGCGHRTINLRRS